MSTCQDVKAGGNGFENDDVQVGKTMVSSSCHVGMMDGMDD